MTIWIDAQLSPALALWIAQTFGISAVALRDIGLRDGTDRQIFLAAKQESTIVMTKDADFVRLLEELGPLPQIIWITCGNSSNAPETTFSHILTTSSGIAFVGRVAC